MRSKAVSRMNLDTDSTLTARGRLLIAGKRLFARLGYEQASTAAIARDAGTSESQLVRHFEGKLGLLDAIFNESWGPLNARIDSILQDAPDGRTAVVETFNLVIGVFERDSDLAYLFLFEGWRIRGPEKAISLSDGFTAFAALLRKLIHRAQKDGSFQTKQNEGAVAAALMGAAEGMIRERMIAQRNGTDIPFAERDMRKAFAALLNGL